MKRFFDKVDKTDGCWNWNAAIRGRSGYGAFKFNGKTIDAHRVSWMIYNGDIPNGLLVCHKCDNKLCVNPNHLFLGTYSDNTKDAYIKGRIVVPATSQFRLLHIPINRSLSESEAKSVKYAIKTRMCSLKKLSESLNLPYQLLRDINCGRTYKNV